MKRKKEYTNIFTQDNIDLIKSYGFRCTIFNEVHMRIDTTFDVKADWYRNGTLVINNVTYLKSKNAETVCERINTFLFRKNGNNRDWKETVKANREYSTFLSERESVFKNL